MPLWKRNLLVCWFGAFISSMGMSQIAPVLPLYLRHLGVGSTSAVEQFSGIAFGVTYIISAIFSPIWGQAADKVGRKPMLLRASLGMSIVIFVMGFAGNVYVLIGLRLLQGAITGYGTACTTLIATQTDREHAGWALGTLSTATISGSLIGPTLGGFIGDTLGTQNVFFATGALLFVSFFTTLFFIRENFVREEKKAMSVRAVWDAVPQKSLTVTMMATFFIATLGLYTIEPIVTVYVSQLSKDASHVALMAGLTFSASGFSSILAAPRLGRLSDKIGPQKICLLALLLAGIFYLPQVFVNNPWQLLVLRFLLGLATAGLIPSVNTIIKRITPSSLTGRVFGLTMSAGYLGVFGGSVLGGQISSLLGIRNVFFVTSALLLLNAVWVYLKVFKRLNNKFPDEGE